MRLFVILLVLVVLLAGAGLLMRNFIKLQSVDLGLDPNNILVARLPLPREQYTTAAAKQQFFEALLPRLHALPGVVAGVDSDESGTCGDDLAADREARGAARDLVVEGELAVDGRAGRRHDAALAVDRERHVLADVEAPGLGVGQDLLGLRHVLAGREGLGLVDGHVRVADERRHVVRDVAGRARADHHARDEHATRASRRARRDDRIERR